MIIETVLDLGMLVSIGLFLLRICNVPLFN
jgi:hypothetical protein